jgi:5,10-methylenetetrahydrofolate reductase
MGLAEAIAGDGFLMLAEVDPPKGIDPAGFLETVTSIRGRVTAVAVTDGAHAIMRMTPLAPCKLLLDRSIEPLMILNGRDRNRISFQGDLMGAWALGVRNVLIKQGQDPAVGDQPMAQSAGDLDLDVMIQCVTALNEGRDLAGETVEGKTDFTIGVALDLSDDVNVNRRTAESIPRLAERGVRFVVLGPTYDMNIVDMLAAAAEDTDVKIMSSVMLLKSVTMIRYLNNLPGVPGIPHEFLKMMMKAPVKMQAGMEIAASFIKDVQERCQGAVLIALGWESRLPEFLDLLGR